MKRVFGAAFTMAATVAVGLSWATIGNAACGKVSIAEMNWASADSNTVVFVLKSTPLGSNTVVFQ